MNELKKKVDELKEKGLPGVSFFLTAGYPHMEYFRGIVRELDKKNLADFLEIGVPFSDPLADGEVIQRSSRAALEKGTGLRKIFREIKKLKEETDLPLVLMSYLNPLLSGDFEDNLHRAAGCGFSGVIIPDLPHGECEEMEESVKKSGLEHIFLAAPSTSAKRLKEISASSSPFLYYVSSYGVTGGRRRLGRELGGKLRKARKLSAVPVYCGFGISTPAQAASLKESLDGIIIGSAFIEKLKGKNFKAPLKFAININKSLGRIKESS